MSERDTHFQDFAKLLFEELYDTGDVWFDVFHDDWRENWRQIIARRAYDLVSHTIMNIDPYHLDALSFEEIPARIPDMTEWPENPM